MYKCLCVHVQYVYCIKFVHVQEPVCVSVDFNVHVCLHYMLTLAVQFNAACVCILVSHLLVLAELLGRASTLQCSLEEWSTHGGTQFEWVDSPLVSALREGHWLILSNANFCKYVRTH